MPLNNLGTPNRGTSEQQLARDKKSVIDAASAESQTQDKVTAATKEGTDAATAQAAANKTLADSLNQLYDAENAVLGSQLSQKEAVFQVGKAVA